MEIVEKKMPQGTTPEAFKARQKNHVNRLILPETSTPCNQTAASLLPFALDALACGLCVIPATMNGEKRPHLRSWETYQHRLSTLDEVSRWFPPHWTGLGLVTGKVSGNLEVLDFDRRDIFLSFADRARASGLGSLLDRLVSGYQEYSPNGAHLPYRCEEIAGNTILARTQSQKKAIIETRGEGGFIVIAPSHGPTHPSGKPYVLESGGFATIQTITPEERYDLFSLARTFTEVVNTKSDERRKQGRADTTGTRSGDLFNARATWDEILLPHGWCNVFERNGETYWRRPGKDRGISGTTNYAGADFLYVFSTSTPFDPERGYSKFSAYALLNHGGDFERAAEDVLRHGYTHNSAAQNNGHAPATAENSQATQQSLPKIIVTNRPLRDISADAIDALQRKNDPPFIFLRSNSLARVIHDERGRPFIDLMTVPSLRGDLTRSAEFLRMRKGERESAEQKFIETHTDPPHSVVQDIIALADRPFPPLVGIVECPVLRPDGTILDQPGYDEATRLFYEPARGLVIPTIKNQPGENDARAARDFILKELLVDFPFIEGADLANFIACLLSPIIRPAITDCVPMCLLDKPGPGSGATLLADIVSTIATGQHARKEPAPEGKYAEEEFRKKITALLLAGAPVIVWDNIEERLRSSALSAVLTTPWWGDRQLGENKQLTLANRAVWIATGNNISLRGDIARRCYRVRIDPQLERPWTRETFKHADLLAWCRQQRGELLAHLLTMARAWFAMGKPKAQTPKLGGFDEWVSTVGGILSFAGLSDFLGNLDELYDAVDDEGPQWGLFLQTWYEELGDQLYTVRSLAGAASLRPRILEALPDSITWDENKLEASRNNLGNALKKRAFRVYNKYRLEKGKPDSHSKTAQWKVIDLRGERGHKF